jgi:retron-type reverse transcriptase
MYTIPRWRGGRNDASARARQIPVSAHAGPARAFLRRHGRDVDLALRGTSQDRARLVCDLLPRVADPRNLFLAVEYLSKHGGQAPGPDGLRYGDLTRSEVYSWARAASKAILNGTYKPGPERVLEIPKASGKGTRTIRLASILDRAVGRAITQILQPALDPLFLDTTVGYRPGRNTLDALALAELHARRGLRAWICEDVRDAFNQIPQSRLLDVLRTHLPDNRLMRLLEAVTVTPSGRGVPQGGCLSPLLLNLYLHHHLDQPWARRHPDTVLIRVADDLLILCPDVNVALDKYEGLKRLLTPAAMPLKGTRDTTTHDLAQGQQAQWLGYSIRAGEGNLVCSTTEKAWSRLGSSLEELSSDSLFPVRAWDAVRGWIGYLGPCFGHQDAMSTHARVRSLLLTHGVDEAPSLEDLHTWWSAAHARWAKLRLRVQGPLGKGSYATGDEGQRGEDEATAPPVAPPPAEPGVCAAESSAGKEGQGLAQRQQEQAAWPSRPGPENRSSGQAPGSGGGADACRPIEARGETGQAEAERSPPEGHCPDRAAEQGRAPTGAPRRAAAGLRHSRSRARRPCRRRPCGRPAFPRGRPDRPGWPPRRVARGPPPGPPAQAHRATERTSGRVVGPARPPLVCQVRSA